MIPMERMLDIYSQPYDARYPVICRRATQTAAGRQKGTAAGAPGHPDTYEYVRRGTCTIWMFVEPLGQWHTHATTRRTSVDWACLGPCGSSALPPSRAPDPGLRPSEHPCLCLFFYRAFPPADARRLARRVHLPIRRRPLVPRGLVRTIQYRTAMQRWSGFVIHIRNTYL